jgi:hypothetical protein
MKFLITPLLVSAVLASGIAHAGTVAVARTQHFNAPAHCQGALPNFEGALRKRPLALQNEGTSNAFVTCAIPTQGRVDGLEVYGSSHAGVAGNVDCTLVSGYKGGTNNYIPKSMTTTADGEWAGSYWDGSDFPGEPELMPSSFIAVSCNLAPGTGLNDFWLYYSEYPN